MRKTFDKAAIFGRMRRYRMKGRLEMDASLANETSFAIGGPADILFFPETVAEAVRAVKLCRRENIPLTVLGNGTNVLVRDGGVRGIVLKLKGIDGLRRERSHIFAGAGTDLAAACDYALAGSLSGVEFACGIPGTVGGAVCMNAGAYGAEMKDIVYRSVVLDFDGNIGLIDGFNHGFAYRKSVFQENGWVLLETEFALRTSTVPEITEKMEDFKRRRDLSQPMDKPSAGSVFRRPETEGVFVGPMVEACGLKGASEGGAQISQKHAGFIINSGGATASDVLALIERVKAEVKNRFDVELATEIRIIGEN